MFAYSQEELRRRMQEGYDYDKKNLEEDIKKYKKKGSLEYIEDLKSANIEDN